jgi:hypothetical protein
MVRKDKTLVGGLLEVGKPKYWMNIKDKMYNVKNRIYGTPMVRNNLFIWILQLSIILKKNPEIIRKIGI